MKLKNENISLKEKLDAQLIQISENLKNKEEKLSQFEINIENIKISIEENNQENIYLCTKIDQLTLILEEINNNNIQVKLFFHKF